MSADGRWTGAPYVLRPDGGRVRRAVYARDAARGRGEARPAGSEDGVPLAVEARTVESDASHWMGHVVAPR